MCEFCKENWDDKNKVISCEIDKCPAYVDCSCKDMNVFMEMIIKYCPMCGRKLSEVNNNDC